MLDQAGVHRQPGLAQGGDEAVVAERTCAQVIAPSDEADAGVSLPEQVLGHFPARTEIVDADAGQGFAQATRCDGHHWNASLDQFAYGGLRFAERRRQDHPVDASGERARRPAFGFGIRLSQ